MPLPPELPRTELVLPVAVDKTASVRFGTNRYSTPPEYAGRHAGPLRGRRARALIDGDREVASHARSWGRMQRIDDPEHRAVLVERRPRTVAMTVRDQLLGAVPELWVPLRALGARGPQVNFHDGAGAGPDGRLRPRGTAHRRRGHGGARHPRHRALTLLCEQ